MVLVITGVGADLFYDIPWTIFQNSWKASLTDKRSIFIAYERKSIICVFEIRIFYHNFVRVNPYNIPDANLQLRIQGIFRVYP